MTQKVSLTLTDDLAQRLTILADIYNCDVIELMQELILDGTTVCEAAIEREACEQITFLATAEPAGRA